MSRSAVALVPARAGSTRVPGKNVRPLAGHPLIAYTLAAAHQSGLFDAVVVSTDSEEIAAVAREYGGEVPGLRPETISGTRSPDIDWVEHTLSLLREDVRPFELFSILRPTSPFRSASTIRRAWEALQARGDAADSIRAVEPCRQHPGKMWVLEGELMRPLLDQSGEGVPTHSRQYQDLPSVYVQNSSLEIAWTRVVTERGDIAGSRVAAFLTDEAEGFTIDYPDDWEQAERWVASGEATLPDVTVAERAGKR
ncbi:MAG: acylneuraminate cytidylyltransferase family protein [Solirubrobacteraceae bacterium]